MQHPALFVGTYHKTGTVWIHRVMRDTAAAIGQAYTYNGVREFGGETLAPGIYFDDHAIFPDALSVIGGAGFRMIRDPRDVVISGAHYHLRSEESWLHMARANLGGQTYQQAIGACDGAQAQYLFEMQHAGGSTISEMAGPNDFVGGLEVVRYEDLMADADFSQFRSLVIRLGFDQDEAEQAVAAFKKHSLIGDAKSTGKHGTSGGKLERWKSAFSRSTAEAFAAKHGDALIALGYEADHSWIESCTA